MKLTFENKYQRAIAVILFIAFIMSLSAILTSCSSANGLYRHHVTDGCGMSRGMIGYGPGGDGRH